MWNCVKHVFWVKKFVGKNLFKNWIFYPLGGSELVKNFEKWGWKTFLRFFGFNQCEIVWNMFFELKKLSEKIFSKIEIFTL